MNERLVITLPTSLLLWTAALLLFSYSLNHEIERPLEGKNTVTVRIVTLPHPATPTPVQASPAPAPPPPPPPKVNKSESKPIKAAKLPQKPQPEKSKSLAPRAPPVPEQHLSEAKSDNHGAVITYQPLPKIPDELRKEAFSTAAVARFRVAADNSATVELITPSQNPRLNHILMDTLKTWKFISASENGKPAASNFTVRVHFSVE